MYYLGVTGVLKGYYTGFTVVFILVTLVLYGGLNGCYRDVTYLLQGCYGGVTGFLQGFIECFRGVTGLFQGCYLGVTGRYVGCYRDVTDMLQWVLQ